MLMMQHSVPRPPDQIGVCRSGACQCPRRVLRAFGFAGLDLSCAVPRFSPAAYSLGLVAPRPAVGYIHMVGVRHDRRRVGLARLLYDEFKTLARAWGDLAEGNR
jgi:GNAT superfamily N-acetyltransferase